MYCTNKNLYWKEKLQVIKNIKTVTATKKLHKRFEKHLIQETVENEQLEVLKIQFGDFNSNCIIMAARK